MKFRNLLLATVAVFSLCFGTNAEAANPQINLQIVGTLIPDAQGRFIVEGDLFVVGGFLDGQKIGSYEDLSYPAIDPNCDPTAAAALGFNAASGVGVFTIGHDLCPLGTFITDNQSCVTGIDLNTLEIDIVSTGQLSGGTGITSGISGTLESSSRPSLITGEIVVDVTLNLSH